MKNFKKMLKVSAATAGALHLINKWIDSSSISKQSSASNGLFYHWKHGDIYYHKIGEGKTPLLLLHDLSPFSASFEWSELSSFLKKDYTLYIPDISGCGKSDKPAITYTSYYFVQMISDFVLNVIGEETQVITSGFSGSFVLMANQMNDQLFEHITLINPPSVSQLKKQPNQNSRMIQRLFDIPFIGTTVYYIITNKLNTENRFTEKLIFNPFNMEPKILKASYDASHAKNGDGKYLLGSLQGNYVNADISRALASAENNIHIIFGSNTHYQEAVKEYRSLNENITIEIVPECKMYPHIEVSDDIYESICTYM